MQAHLVGHNRKSAYRVVPYLGPDASIDGDPVLSVRGGVSTATWVVTPQDWQSRRRFSLPGVGGINLPEVPNLNTSLAPVALHFM